jgi:alanine racemase
MVELIGGSDGVDGLAAAAGTIGYEVLTRLGSRFNRRYIRPGSTKHTS